MRESCRFPTQPEEAWPGSRTSAASTRIRSHGARTARSRPTRRRRLLDLDVAGMAVVTEAGIEIERVPEGIRFEALTEDDPRLYSLVGWDEKFAAHNAGGGLEARAARARVPTGVELEKLPLYVRIAGSVERGSLFFRLLVVAEERSRFTLIEEYSSARPDLSAYSNAVAELFVGQAAKLEYVSIQNLSQETWHFASHHARVERDGELDWVAGGFGSKSGKIRIQNDLNGPGATSRVTGAPISCRRQPAPRLRHLPGAHRTLDRVGLRLQGRAARARRTPSGVRGMIRVEEAAQKTNAYPGELVTPSCSLRTHTPTRSPGSRSSRRRRPLHPRRGRSAGSTARKALLPDGARPSPRRGRTADRPAGSSRSDPRPDRARNRFARPARGRARGPHPTGPVSPRKTMSSAVPAVPASGANLWKNRYPRVTPFGGSLDGTWGGRVGLPKPGTVSPLLCRHRSARAALRAGLALEGETSVGTHVDPGRVCLSIVR